MKFKTEIKSDQINNLFNLGHLNIDWITQNGWKVNQLCQIQNLECLSA